MAGAIRADVRMLPLDFDGGDLWVSGGNVFVPHSVLERNEDAPVLEILGRELGAEPVVIDGPPHHVGMFATPLHDGRILAGPDAVVDELRRAGHRAIPIPFATTARDQGFEVVRIPCGAIYGKGGTVHSLGNVLERS